MEDLSNLCETSADRCRFVGYAFGALLLLVWCCITTVPAGHVGVVDVFGSVKPDPLHPGISIVNPFAKVVHMSVRTQLIEVAEEVPTKEGLAVHLEAAALFYLKPSHATTMYRLVGQDYLNTVVKAQFRSVVREVTSGHEAKDLYTSARLEMTRALKDGFAALVQSRGIAVEETPLKKLELPAALQATIENKLEAEQASQKMQFLLDKERQEAKRKSIEAGGISTFQQVVSGDISTGMLRWKGIEATERLAEDPNPKTVIIGGGKGGVPMILNDGK
jgi:regulator of protease activity HflC (stomatin/prohibitin superfamily)|eukprot:CAMPEP_0174306930 /NCGR_PEP_ID=MMETSP0810-20121108/783_1 /TAXON_ID=73025 ORGANISM="Eutreptiella gymnastica-like, Strain CCMP1594" /NCGR_SAMPLE_ID=MMETSP0810 /ASSEMBLY_ACC=CAM_ASM_000659 /LENGTH=275 /DNA_ID=CAMNT_0015413817 /DNA_START=29 /DNA_END=856 /DNA_ORIENTATION=+